MKIQKSRAKLRAFELVLLGHPDKVCDLVSKAICDANRMGRNAIECMWGNFKFIVSGETDKGWSDSELDTFVRGILREVVGLTDSEMSKIEVVNNLNCQSSEIDSIVGDVGTGDNGIYFGGYHKIYSPVILRMKAMCDSLTCSVLKAWGYRTDGKFIFHVDPKGNIVDLVLNIASYSGVVPDVDSLVSYIRVFTGSEADIYVNPKGDWHKCFGFADCGLTGRKLACDGSCGLFSHGGGAMFGKDVSKADVTVPLYLAYLAELHAGRKKVCEFSASSVIGDSSLTLYKDGKYFDVVPFVTMKKWVLEHDLTIFGVVK